MLYTLGHSTHTAKEFLDILRAYGIRQLIDVRTIPRSRRNPQFNRDKLGPYLRRHRINYRNMKSLGGLRRPNRALTLNNAWRNSSFRGFADYMQTHDFQSALGQLLTIARKKKTAIMCAEAVPWRCHRGLIADAATVRGTEATDIFSRTMSKPHRLTSFAKVRAGRLTYPA